jgi:hypothetical protein
MEIRKEPYNLQINDNTITLCPCCNFVVIKEIKKGKYLIDECYDCIKGTRPFSYSSGLKNRFYIWIIHFVSFFNII